MLKNNNQTLPIKKDLKYIYIVGPTATNEDVLLGNYYGTSANMNSILAGINGKVHPGTSIQYKHGILLDRENKNPIDWTTEEAYEADIIFGDVSPSGRLPITFPENLDDLPPYEDYAMVGRTYKYMEKEPLYPFGFSLSFTDFSYEDITLNQNVIAEGDSVLITATIRNNGKVAAREVVQMYLTDMKASARTPFYDLKGIQWVDIEPGKEKWFVLN